MKWKIKEVKAASEFQANMRRVVQNNTNCEKLICNKASLSRIFDKKTKTIVSWTD